MPADLGKTPIHIRTRRGWSIGFFLFGIALCALTLWVWRTDPTTPLKFTLALSLFSPLILLVSGAQLLRPATLEITANGLVHSDMFVRHDYRWREISAPRIHRVWFVPHVVFDYHPDDQRMPLWRRILRFREGYGATLGGGWEMPAAELAALLVAAKARWV